MLESLVRSDLVISVQEASEQTPVLRVRLVTCAGKEIVIILAYGHSETFGIACATYCDIREMDDWIPNAKSDNWVPKQIESHNKVNLGGRQLSPK